MYNRRAYKAWWNMQDRCNNPNYTHYANYGGRGVTYEPRWELYENFISDLGPCPDGMFLDREDNNLNYTKDNCRWVSRAVSCENRRTTILTKEQAWTIRMLGYARNPSISVLKFSEILGSILGTSTSLTRDVVRGKSWRNLSVY